MPPEAKLVVYSVAVPFNNPELKKARDLGITTKSYAEAVGDLTKQYKTLAIAGAHGKSTTTALLSLVLIKAGFDPTVIIGTKLKEFKNSNFRDGKGTYLVLEADEYHHSFLNYSPFAAIITNIDREHLDFYKNLNAIKNAFLKFIKNIQVGGFLILNRDDKILYSLKNKIEDIAKKSSLKIFWYGITNFRRSSIICYKIKKVIKIPGIHNVSNALAVYTLARLIGIKEKEIFDAFNNYRGAWRRLEYRGKLVLKPKSKIVDTKYQIPVYDDYGHHPTEVKATLSGLKEEFPQSKIICVFQPHQAQRLKYLFKEFTLSFDNADILILLDIYKVKGREQVSQNEISSQDLAEAIKKRKRNSPKVFYLPYSKNLAHKLKNLIINNFKDSHYVIVMMGAGDIYKMTDNLIK